jgi:hypothetical protein
MMVSSRRSISWRSVHERFIRSMSDAMTSGREPLAAIGITWSQTPGP